MTNQEIINYYAGLLILQYLGKPKAYATIQTLVAPVIMNQLPLAVQNAFTVGNQVVNGITYPSASGVQLDVLGEYAGVSRNGVDTNGNPVTLDDSDFVTLIKVAILKNNAGSSLADIQTLLQVYFANEIFVYDGANMQMSYLIAASVGSQSLIELFITEGLLPKPMGVALASVVYIPIISLFGFQTYEVTIPAWSSVTTYALGQRVFVNGIVYTSLVGGNLNNAVTNATYWEIIIYPFNSYVTYPTYEPYTWLSYANGLIIV